MAGTNDFLPFATAGGANVLSQAAYAALSAVATGYQSGVAQSPQLNKTWRQASIIASMVAQFIVDQTGANAVDDGTIATLEANFIAALRFAGVAIGTDTGLANACVVNFTPAIPSLVDGMVLWFQAAASNTGAATINVSGLGAKPLVGAAQTALQGGEVVAGGKCMVVWSAGLASFVLIECTGAALQVAAPTKSGHAVQAAQVQGNALVYGVDSGAANACVVVFAPAPAALADGMVFWFKAAASNTGAATLNVNGLGAKAVVGAAGSALQGGEIAANGTCQVVWKTNLNSFVLIECTGAALQVSAGTQTSHAVNLGQLGTRGLVSLTTSGNFTVPAAVYVLDAQGWGGGGGGGGSGGGGGTSGGGGGAGYARKRIAVTPGQVIAYVIGAGGSGGGAGGSGSTGSATSFGAYFTAQAGTGGTLNPAGNAGPGGGGVGGDVNMAGGSGGTGSSSNVQGGAGGSAAGGGGGSGGAQGNASAGGFPGGGGGGGGSAASGGTGGAGLIVVSY